MAGWMVLITIILFLVASAFGCYPGKERIAKKLNAAAVVSMLLTAGVSMLYQENMFSDALAVPSSLWIRAILAIVVCAGMGIVLARLAGGKYR